MIQALVSWKSNEFLSRANQQQFNSTPTIEPDQHSAEMNTNTFTYTSDRENVVENLVDVEQTSDRVWNTTLDLRNVHNVHNDIWNTSLPDEVSNATVEFQPHMEHLGLALVLYAISGFTVFGNSLVIIAVIKNQNLHSATNYLISSLAVADLLVGLVVMPFNATYQGMEQSWIFGQVWCELWQSLDVLASTASILNLCVISLDRYWAITSPFTYPIRMSDRRASVLISLVWICSCIISFPAIAWWRSTSTGPPPPWQCLFTEDIGYLIFSSTVSFYGPLSIMVFTYIRIFQAARSYSRSLKTGTKQLSSTGNGEVTLRIHRGGADGHTQSPLVPDKGVNDSDKKRNNTVTKRLSRFSKETKAAKTLGTVMGVFIICWLPFFVINIIAGFCPSCIKNHELVNTIATWLGWANSSMNPVIYACCSRELRRAFVKTLVSCMPDRKLTCVYPIFRSQSLHKKGPSPTYRGPEKFESPSGTDSLPVIYQDSISNNQEIIKKGSGSPNGISLPCNREISLQVHQLSQDQSRDQKSLGAVRSSNAERYLLNYRMRSKESGSTWSSTSGEEKERGCFLCMQEEKYRKLYADEVCMYKMDDLQPRSRSEVNGTPGERSLRSLQPLDLCYPLQEYRRQYHPHWQSKELLL